MKEQKNIDKLFKDVLNNPDLEYDDLDWQAMEEKLEGKRKRGPVALYWMAGIAAMLIIAFLLIKLQDKTGKALLVKRVNSKEQNSTSGKLSSEPTVQHGVVTTRLNPHDKNPTVNTAVLETNVKSAALKPLNDKQPVIAPLVPATRPVGFNLSLVSDPSQINPDDLKINNDIALGSMKQTLQVNTRKKPTLSLSILAAPDLTTVQRSGRSSLSGGLGLEATLSLSKHFSISTGAIYAKKIYDSDYSLYNPNSSYVFKSQPTDIHSNCDVLDIPLNVNYKVFSNAKNVITVTTGLSSYLMLKEKYSYSYQSGYNAGPASYEVSNQNKHFMGIANISATFQHKVNGRLNIGFTPFLKVPLTNIGYGNSKLSSTGIAVSVTLPDLFNKK